MGRSAKEPLLAKVPPGAVKVAIVNDYEVIVAGVREMIRPYADRVAVVEVDVEHSPRRDVDVALFDTYGRRQLGLDTVATLAGSKHVAAVAVYTWEITAAGVKAALDAGARGVVAKAIPAGGLVEALVAISRGEVVVTDGFQRRSEGTWPGSASGLTARESEVLAMLSTGMVNRDIAAALYVSENTIRTHLKSMFRKLEVTNRSEAVIYALADPSFAIRPTAKSSRRITRRPRKEPPPG